MHYDYRRGYRLRGLLSLVLLLAAAPMARSESAPAAETLRIDACELLESAEIAEVVGRPVGPGERRGAGHEANGAYSSLCLWTIGATSADEQDPAAPLAGYSFVMLHVMRWPAGSGLSGGYLQAFRDAAVLGEIPATPIVRNYGDEALWWGDGLAVRQGDVSFGISLSLRDRHDARPGLFEEGLAPLVLQRLAD